MSLTGISDRQGYRGKRADINTVHQGLSPAQALVLIRNFISSKTE